MAWLLIAAQVGGYGNVALAMGIENGVPAGNQAGMQTEAAADGRSMTEGSGQQDAEAGTGSEDGMQPGGSGGGTQPGGNGDETQSGGSGDGTQPGGSGDETQPGGSGDGTQSGGSGDGTQSGGSGDETQPGGSGDGTQPGGSGDENQGSGENGDGQGDSQDEEEPDADQEEPADQEQNTSENLSREGYTPFWENPGFSNLIVFVDFADTDHNHPESIYGECYKENVDRTFRYFNGGTDYPFGMRQYLYNISYGQLCVENIFPQYDETEKKITPYKLPGNGADYAQNEGAMVEEVIKQLNASGQLGEDVKLDLNNREKIVDNLTIVVPCDDGNTTRLFGDHEAYHSGNSTLNGCIVRPYNILTESGIYYEYSESGVIVHEFLHSLGYPDLYRRASGNPVGTWDIMSTENRYLQYPLAYLRSAYTNWFEIPTVTTSQKGVSLYAASATTEETKDRQALILKTDYSENEFFVVEYRKKGTMNSDKEYDVKIPGSGLIIYRVNKSYETNITGPPDMIYVFRPGDTRGENGYENGGGGENNEPGKGIFYAHLSRESGRVSYGTDDFTKSLEDGAITYSDGANSGIVISNVGSATGDEITFDITFSEPQDGEFWSTYAREEEGNTSMAASCMDGEGTLYYLLKRGNYFSGQVSLYKCKDGVFTRMGDGPAGTDHKLVEFGGALYTAYLKNWKPALARWNGSSWQELYVAPIEAGGPDLASDEKGVYLAYAKTDGTQIKAVHYNGSRVSDLGTQVGVSTKFAANPSIAAENGTVVVMYREAGNNNKIYIKRYNSGTNAWEDVGEQSFSANTGLIRVHNSRVFLMKNGTVQGENAAYLYVYDLVSESGWKQVGENTYADTALVEADLCFVEGRPYVVYMSGKAPYATEVKRLQDNQWTNLGGSVVTETLSCLRAYFWNDQIYISYLNDVSNKVLVKTHASEADKTDKFFGEDGVYRGEIREGQDGGKWLYISDIDAKAHLSDEEILTGLRANGKLMNGKRFAGIFIVRTDDGQGQLDKTLRAEIINEAVPMLEKDGILSFLFQDTTGGNGRIIRWELKNPHSTDRDRNGKITARQTGGAKSPWSLEVADTDFPAEETVAVYSDDSLAAAYETQTSGEEQRPVYYYETEESGERTFLCEGTYTGVTGEPSDVFDKRTSLTIPVPDSIKPGTAYTAETSRYDWRVEYGYTEDENGSLNGGTILYVPSQEEAAAALGSLNLPEGTNVRVRCTGEDQPLVIDAGILERCGENGLHLEFERWDKKTKTTFIWKIRGLRPRGEGYADFTLRTSVVTRDAFIPVEFEERSYVQVTPHGQLPACGELILEIRQKGIADRFAGADSVCLWQQKDDQMKLLENPVNYSQEDGSWLFFALDVTEAGSQGTSYVVSTQSAYGWQVVEGSDGKLYVRYIENRSGKPVTGWEIVENRRCYFDGNGYLVQGPAKIDGVWYLFGDYGDGTFGIRTGYQSYPGISKSQGISDANAWEGLDSQVHTYYTNASGAIQKGWQKINNIWHYFSGLEDSFGQELSSVQEGYWVTMGEDAGEMSGRRYYFRNNTTLLKNWQTIDGKRYFFAPEGYARTGWYPNAGDKNVYYLNELGQMQTGYTEVIEKTAGQGEAAETEKTAHYFFHTNGLRQYGWQKAGEVWHYFQPDAAAENYGQELLSRNTSGYWYEMGGNTYYFVKNAKLATGWQTIDGKRYYFDAQGRMYTGTWKIGSGFYHFHTGEELRGVLGTGLFADEGKTYYANASGVLFRGWQKIDGIWRFFNQETGAEEKGKMETNYWAVVSDEDGKTTKIFYFLNGTRAATGWQTIEGRRYYFDGNGILKTGFFKVGNNTYYGRIAEELSDYPGENLSGEQVIDGSTYYFGTNYAMYVGWQKIAGVWRFFSMDEKSPVRGQEQTVSGPGVEASWYWYTVNGEKYCFRSNNALLKGWQTINGQRYYLDPVTGAASVGKTQKIGNYTYCFDSQGIMQKNTIVDGFGYNANGYRVSGWQKINNEWFYFDASSKDPETWKQVPFQRNGYWITLEYDAREQGTNQGGGALRRETYYFRNNASLVKGWQNIDGARYYFDPKTGVLQLGNQDGLYAIGANTYYLGQDGALRYGWIREAEDGSVYYANASGVLLSGWQKIENLWYYFDRNTRKQDVHAAVGDDYFAMATENGVTNTYYFLNGTSLARGWQTIEGRRYYFDTATYAMKTGFFQAGKTWHYFHEDRTPMTGWWKNPDTGKTYYFDKNGQALTGWQTIEGSRYYFDANGIRQTQRVKIGSTWYFFGPDGKMRTGFVKYCDTTFYFNSKGQMLKGWQTIDGKRYYFDAEGAMQTGFVTIGTAVYYFDEKAATRGQLLKGEQIINGATYYFNNNGVRMYGWQKLNYVWRFFDVNTGIELHTETDVSYWVTVTMLDGKEEKAFINNGASVLKGWQTIGGKRYYFDANGFLWNQTKGWFISGSNRYYFCEDGSVYQGFLTLEDGNGTEQTYYLNGNGLALKGWQTVNGNRYYLDPTTGAAWMGHQMVGKNWYYFNPADNGCMAKGYIRDAKGKGYYYNTSGVRLTGWQKISNVWHYFDVNDGGERSVSIDENYWATVTLGEGREERAFIKNGASVLKGWQVINGKRYYFDASGFLWDQAKGWFVSGSNRYYFHEDGSVYQGFLELTDENGVHTYYLNANGLALKGWQTIKVGTVSGRYYFDPSTCEAYMGHKKIGSYWYYFDAAEQGKMATGYIRDARGDHYYFNTNGTALTGFRKLPGETQYRYFDAAGNRDGSGYGVERALSLETVSVGRNTYYWYTIGDGNCTVDGSTYCFLNNSTLLRNRQTIDGKYYWFHSSTGALYRGYFAIGQNRYYSNDDGTVYTGFDPEDVTSARDICYYNIYGQRVTGWQTIKDKDGLQARYYFNANGVMLKGICWLGNTRYVFHPESGKLITDSVEIGGKTYYANTNGTLKTGWQKIYNSAKRIYETFYFGTDGLRHTGWQEIGGKRYSFSPDGVMRTGFVENIDGLGKDYYFNGSGVMLTGWYRFQVQGVYVWRYFAMGTGERLDAPVDSSMPETARYVWYRVVENGMPDTYCIYNNGTLLKGYQNIGGRRYFFDTAGKLNKGWFLSGNNQCYSDPQTGAVESGFREIEGATYYLNTNGMPLKGWQRIYDSAAKVYTYYYFNDRGVLLTGEVREEAPTGEAVLRYQWRQIGEDWYCIYNNTTVLKGFYNIGTWRYYFDTKTGVLEKGHFAVGTVKYYSDRNTGGISRLGCLLTDADGNLTYYDGNGRQVTGWLNRKDGDVTNRYYFQPGSGIAASGFTKAGNYDYYFDTSTKALQKNPSSVIKGVNAYGKEVIYYTGRYEYLLSGWQKVDGIWYYFDAVTKEGTKPQAEDNWVTLEGDQYYFIKGTTLAKGWQTIARDGVNGRYYFNGSGILQKGWFSIGANRYYMNEETGKAQEGIKTFTEGPFGGNTYYFDSNGLMRKGWITCKDTQGVSHTYYFNANGIQLKGICWIGNTRYVLDPTTGEKITTSVVIDGKTFYANTNGTLKTGWQKIYNSVRRVYESFYFGTDGQRCTGWQVISGKTYYFDKDGVVMTGLQTIPGPDTEEASCYYFNGSGVMLTGWYRFKENGVYLWRYFGTDGKQIEPLFADTVTPMGETNKSYTWYQVEEPDRDRPSEQKVLNWYCIYNNTTVLKGFYNIGKWRYYFDGTTNVLRKGAFKVGAASYYSDEKTGAIDRLGLLRTDEDDQKYYYDGNGLQKTGWITIKTGIHEGKYYFQPGTAIAASGFTKIGNYYYYFDPVNRKLQKNASAVFTGLNPSDEQALYYTGKYEYLLGGWQKVNGSWYYFDTVTKEGSIPEASENNWITLEGEQYYFRNGTTLVKGWQTINVNGVNGRYYFDANGALKKGLFAVGANWYYTNPDTGKAEAGFQELRGNTYYFDANGLRRSGWISVKGTDGVTNTYYFNANGEMRKGICWIGNTRYVLHPATGARITTYVEIDGKTYYANTNGTLKTGWQKIYNSATRVYEMFYFGTEGLKCTGWQEIAGKKYYFNDDGVMQTGIQTFTETDQETGREETYTCYFNGSGVMLTGWYRFKENGVYVWKYFGADGKQIEPLASGIVTPMGETNKYYTWYQVEEPAQEEAADALTEGQPERKTVVNWYCIYNNTTVLKQYYNIGASRYYFDAATGILQKGHFMIGTAACYSDPETGAISRQGLFYTDQEGELFYYDGNGRRVTGWLTLKSGEHAGKYYFNTLTGAAYRGGWFYVDNVRYLFDIEGKVREVPVISGISTPNYGTAVISWKEVIGAKSYILEYSTDAAFSSPLERIFPNGELSAEITGLEAGVRYYFRLKYTLDNKKGDGTEESVYSAVKNIVPQNELTPTGTSAVMQSFALADVTDGDTGETKTGIRAEFTVKGRLKSYGGDGNYYLVRVDTYYNRILGSPLCEISKEDGLLEGSYFRFLADLDVQGAFEEQFGLEEGSSENPSAGRYAQMAMSGYALAVKSSAGGYTIISKKAYVSNPEYTAASTAGYFHAASKKGIQGAIDEYLDETGTKNTLFNLDIKEVIRSGPGSGRVAYQYKGKEYYFEKMEKDQARVREWNRRGINVSCVLLMSYGTGWRAELIRPEARRAGAAPYYMLNTTTQVSQETLEAFFCYMGEIFGQDDCYISNWILGNEVNSCNAWNYKGSLSFGEYMRGYSSAFRTLYYGIVRTRPSSRVFISLDNAWNRAVAGYTGKQTLDSFASYIQAESPDIAWNVAFHPYSAPLTRTDFWNDYSNTSNSVGSPYISMRNLDYFTNYLGTLENKYKKEPGSIRVSLAEQGWTSYRCGEKSQAEALARGYAIAEKNSRVDSFIIRAELDDVVEMQSGLYLGIRNRDHTKKTSCYVYTYMDASGAAMQEFLNANPADKVGKENIGRFKDAQSILKVHGLKP